MIEPEESQKIDEPTDALPVTGIGSAFETGDQQVNGAPQRKTSSQSSVTKGQESAILESWRVNFEADIKARDEREAAKRIELEANAKKVVEVFPLVDFLC